MLRVAIGLSRACVRKAIFSFSYALPEMGTRWTNLYFHHASDPPLPESLSQSPPPRLPMPHARPRIAENPRKYVLGTEGTPVGLVGAAHALCPPVSVCVIRTHTPGQPASQWLGNSDLRQQRASWHGGGKMWKTSWADLSCGCDVGDEGQGGQS